MTNIEVSQSFEEQQRIFARMCRVFAEVTSLYAELCNFKYFFHPVQLNRLVKQHQALVAQHHALRLEYLEAADRTDALRHQKS